MNVEILAGYVLGMYLSIWHLQISWKLMVGWVADLDTVKSNFLCYWYSYFLVRIRVSRNGRTSGRRLFFFQQLA